MEWKLPLVYIDTDLTVKQAGELFLCTGGENAENIGAQTIA